MRNETFKKGDLAVTKVMLDLQQKGYGIFIPVGEQWAFDLIAYKETENKFIRLQVKYLGSYKKELKGKKKYSDNAFDYYAGYIPDLNIIIYPSIKFKGHCIVTQIPNSSNAFYWYEDFLNFTDEANPKTCKELGIKTTRINTEENNLKRRKVVRPTKEELERMVWEKPCSQIAQQFGVSDNAVAKWCKSYGIVKPSVGYWQQFLKNKKV